MVMVAVSGREDDHHPTLNSLQMKIVAAFASLVLAASSVLAIDCEPYNGSPTGIILPTAGTNVTAGVPFDFAFCSDAYFKTSTRQIQIGFEQSNGNLHLLAYDVRLAGYEQKLTFQNGQFGTGRLVVYETQNGYYNRYNFGKSSVQLQLKRK
ncbi:hypothetical protein V8E36_005786 [Tilletia maclaganii]